MVANGSALLHAAFVGITLLLALLFVAAVYRASLSTGLSRMDARRSAILATLGGILWIGVTFIAASRGALHFDGRPPTMILLLVVTLGLAIALGMSPLGFRLATGLPLALLVGFQGFRVLVELALHRAYAEDLMPVQMSYSGRNFDIVSGLTAIIVGLWLATGERQSWRPVVTAWNVLGMLLLLNILVVALLSAPTPLRVFTNEPANVWITHAPWVWLPTVMVLFAILGHLLVLRRLRRSSNS